MLSTDEKTGIQARSRIHPTLAPAPGRATRVEREYRNPAVGRFTTTALVVPITTSVKRLGPPGTCGLPAGKRGELVRLAVRCDRKVQWVELLARAAGFGNRVALNSNVPVRVASW